MSAPSIDISLCLGAFSLMIETEPSFPMILAFAAPFFVLSVAMEWFFVARSKAKGDYETKDAFASMTMGLGNLFSDILMGFISLAIMMWLWQFRITNWGYGVVAFLSCLVLQDLLYYWKHRFAHTIRWLWSAHVVHHSSEHYNLSTALRQPWNNHFTGYVFLSFPLIVAGFHPLLIIFVGNVNLIYQFWIHTEAINKCPKWFEAVFNTPSHHRCHHGTNPRYLDCNFAGIWIIWDKMFGTFVPENADEKISYGIVKPVGSFNPVIIAFQELFNIIRDVSSPGLSLTNRLGYIFARPGYSHDGSRQTSQQIKADYVVQHPDQAGMPGLPNLPLAQPAE